MSELTATSQRYRVEKSIPYGYSIIDTKGEDKPYTICFAQNTADVLADLDTDWFELVTNFKEVQTETGTKYVHCHDPAYMSETDLAAWEAHDLKTAQGWCDTWNLVASGHCGSCKKLFAADEKRYPAVGYNVLYRTICFPCACSQED